MANLAGLKINDTGSLTLPAGTNANRPSITTTAQSFTSVGTTSWTAPTGVTQVEVLVVAGGGGGGADRAGGGGAGGVIYNSAYPVIPGNSYLVTVGAGGAGATIDTNKGSNGGNSVFDLLTAIGGGGGGSENTKPGSNGGSGGGAAYGSSSGGAGTIGQGTDGAGSTRDNPHRLTGGGGGASSAGTVSNGGDGVQYGISGTLTYYGGGGGGGATSGDGGGARGTTTPGLGGLGGGGTGGLATSDNTRFGVNGTANTGGGGGGGGGATSFFDNAAGGTGGSGTVIVRYSTVTNGLAVGQTRFNTTTSKVETYTATNKWEQMIPVPRFEYDASNPITYSGTGLNVTDLYGNGFNGTIVNNVGFSTQNNGSFLFDNTKTQYIRISNGIDLFNNESAIHIVATIKLTVNSGIWDGVIANKVNAADGFCLLVNPQRQVFWQFDGTGGQINGGGGQVLELNKWYVIAASYDGTTLKTYVNGKLDNTSTSTGKVITATGHRDIFVGAQNGPVGEPGATFPGYISDIKIYNRALTDDENLMIYQKELDRLIPESARGVISTIVKENLVVNVDIGNPYSYNIANGSRIVDLASGNLGSVSGTTYSTNFEGFLNFNGTSDQVPIGTVRDLTSGDSARTFCAWVYTLGTKRAVILNQGGGGTTNGTIDLEANVYHSSANPSNFYGIHYWGDSVRFNQATIHNQWVYVAFSHRGGAINNTNSFGFFNGNPVTLQDSATINTNNTSVTIGMNPGNTGNNVWFEGRIGLVQIYNRALSVQELRENFEAQRKRYGV
jgi:hypothetical protein